MIDSHCHFDFSEFDAHRSATLNQCAQHGVRDLVIPGVAIDQWQTLVKLQADLCSAPCRLHIAAGIHPWWLESTAVSPEELKESLSCFVQRHRVVAVGECGLDGKRALSVESQRKFFDAQIEVAIDHQLPLIVHAYAAHNQVLQSLSRYRPAAGGVVHGFSGSFELAQQYWRLGFLIGVGGTITYPRASKTRNAIQKMPLESLLLETDAPDMPLQGHQGEVNSPLFLPELAAALATLKGESIENVERQTDSNSRRLFSL